MAAKTAAKEAAAAMDMAQITDAVKRAIQRALDTTAQIGNVKLKSKGNALTISIDVTVEDVRLQLLPFEKPATNGATAQDDLELADA